MVDIGFSPPLFNIDNHIHKFIGRKLGKSLTHLGSKIQYQDGYGENNLNIGFNKYLMHN